MSVHLLSIMLSVPTTIRPPQSQVMKWVFTYQNYNHNINYKEYLLVNTHIKRAVLGYETAPITGLPHLQGYVEFIRSQRLSFVRRIFPDAHWAPSRRPSTANWIYCTKSGRFDTIGNFSVEMQRASSVALPVSVMLKGLLNQPTSLQAKVSNEYSNKFQYYQYMVPLLENVASRWKQYDSWKVKLLYPWQYTVLRSVMTQNDREVLWICDPQGNHGKTFLGILGRYLQILYHFALLDGIISCRDLVHIVDAGVRGAVFD